MATVRSILVVVAVIACGGGGGNGGGGPTSPNNPGNPPPGNPGNPPPGNAPTSGSVAMRSENDGYGVLAHTFNPSSVTIAQTGTVTWTNATGELHNVTFVTASGAPQDVGNHSNGTNSRSFSSTGTFNYNCTNHAGMSGNVVVQ